MQLPTAFRSTRITRRHDKTFASFCFYNEVEFVGSLSFCGFADSAVDGFMCLDGYGWLQWHNLSLRGTWKNNRLIEWESLHLDQSVLFPDVDSSSGCLPTTVTWSLSPHLDDHDLESCLVFRNMADLSKHKWTASSRLYVGDVQWSLVGNTFQVVRSNTGRYEASWCTDANQHLVVTYHGEWFNDMAHGTGTAMIEYRNEHGVMRTVTYQGNFSRNGKGLTGGSWIDQQPNDHMVYKGTFDVNGLPLHGKLRTPTYTYDGPFYQGKRCGVGSQTMRMRDQEKAQDFEVKVSGYWTVNPPRCFGWLTMHVDMNKDTIYYGEMSVDGMPTGSGIMMIDVPQNTLVSAEMLKNPSTLPCRQVYVGMFAKGKLVDNTTATIYDLVHNTMYKGPVFDTKAHDVEEEGVLTQNGRQVYCGQWSGGKYHGQGRAVLLNQRGQEVVFHGTFEHGRAVTGVTDRLAGCWNGEGQLTFPPSVILEYDNQRYAGGVYTGLVEREYPASHVHATMQFGPPLLSPMETQQVNALLNAHPQLRGKMKSWGIDNAAIPSAIPLVREGESKPRMARTLSVLMCYVKNNDDIIQFVDPMPVMEIHTSHLIIN